MKSFYQWNKAIQSFHNLPCEPTEEQTTIESNTLKKETNNFTSVKLRRFKAQRQSKSNNKMQLTQTNFDQQTDPKKESLFVGMQIQKNLFNNAAIKQSIQAKQANNQKWQRIHHRGESKSFCKQKRLTLKQFLESQLASIELREKSTSCPKKPIQILSRSLNKSIQGEKMCTSQRFYTIAQQQIQSPFYRLRNDLMKRTSYENFAKKTITHIDLYSRNKTVQSRKQQKKSSQVPSKQRKQKNSHYLIISPLAINMLKIKKSEKRKASNNRQRDNSSINCNIPRKKVIIDSNIVKKRYNTIQ